MSVQLLRPGAFGADKAARIWPHDLAGRAFVYRYFAPFHNGLPNPKCLTMPEAVLDLDAGIDIGPVWEASANDALGGKWIGQLHGADCRLQFLTFGVPPGVAVQLAIDRNTQPHEIAVSLEYAEAFRAELGPSWPVFLYANQRLLNAALPSFGGGCKPIPPTSWNTDPGNHPTVELPGSVAMLQFATDPMRGWDPLLCTLPIPVWSSRPTLPITETEEDDMSFSVKQKGRAAVFSVVTIANQRRRVWLQPADLDQVTLTDGPVCEVDDVNAYGAVIGVDPGPV